MATRRGTRSASNTKRGDDDEGEDGGQAVGPGVGTEGEQQAGEAGGQRAFADDAGEDADRVDADLQGRDHARRVSPQGQELGGAGLARIGHDAQAGFAGSGKGDFGEGNHDAGGDQQQDQAKADENVQGKAPWARRRWRDPCPGFRAGRKGAGGMARRGRVTVLLRIMDGSGTVRPAII
jgi:hypothetical protein